MRKGALWAAAGLAGIASVVPALPAGAVTDNHVQYTDGFRLAGADRFETAALLAHDGWDTSSTALLVTGFNWPDAIAAGPVGATNDWPILLTGPTDLPAVTQGALTDLKVTKLVLVGGEAVISAALQQKLAQTYQVERVAGPDRYATAATLASRVVTRAGFDANVVRGDQFADALQVSLAWSDEPLLLTPPGQVPTKETMDFLAAAKPAHVWGYGDPAAVMGIAAVQNLGLEWGIGSVADAIDRSVAVTNPANIKPNADVVLVSGVNWPDAIAATPWAWNFDLWVFLTQDTCLRKSLFDFLDQVDPLRYFAVIGGPAAVSEDVFRDKVCA
jgi:putative cell wall-binding protein